MSEHVHKWVKIKNTQQYHGRRRKSAVGKSYIPDGGCGKVESYQAKCVVKPCNVKFKTVTIQCCDFIPSKHA